jgi:hypothetical protein
VEINYKPEPKKETRMASDNLGRRLVQLFSDGGGGGVRGLAFMLTLIWALQQLKTKVLNESFRFWILLDNTGA